MVNFYFHDYAGATYTRQYFDMFCEEWGYAVHAQGSFYEPATRDNVTRYVADEKTAAHCYCHFPHNVTMGCPVQV